MEVKFDVSALDEIRQLIGKFAARRGWDAAMMARLDVASEETLRALLRQDEDAAEAERRQRSRLAAQNEDGTVFLEFVAAKGKKNLQDWFALLGEPRAHSPNRV